jgi:hypothetical protein
MVAQEEPHPSYQIHPGIGEMLRGAGHPAPTPLTRLSRNAFRHNAVRLQLHAVAYNLSNFLRTLVLPEEGKDCSLTILREKLVKLGAASSSTAATPVPAFSSERS